jgi:hypothetical protein
MQIIVFVEHKASLSDLGEEFLAPPSSNHSDLMGYVCGLLDFCEFCDVAEPILCVPYFVHKLELLS